MVLNASYRRRRREFEVVEPEFCAIVVISPINITAKVCRTSKEVSEKYRCSTWVSIRFLVPVLGLGLLSYREFSVKTVNFSFINIKHGKRVNTYVCYEDILTQILALLFSEKTVDYAELLHWIRMLAKIYLVPALGGDIAAADVLSLEIASYAARRIEEIMKQKQQSQQ